jgi:hypothetical protein
MHYVMKAKREVNIQIHVLLTLTLIGGEYSSSCSGRFNLRTQWVELKADLDDLQMTQVLLLQGLEVRSPAHPVLSQSLYPSQEILFLSGL